MQASSESSMTATSKKHHQQQIKSLQQGCECDERCDRRVKDEQLQPRAQQFVPQMTCRGDSAVIDSSSKVVCSRSASRLR